MNNVPLAELFVLPLVMLQSVLAAVTRKLKHSETFRCIRPWKL